MGEAPLWHILREEVAQAQAQGDVALALSRQNRDREAIDAITATRPLFRAIEEKSAALVDLNQRAVDRAADGAAERHKLDSWIQHAITGAILLAVLLGGYLVTRVVVRAQQQLEYQSDVLAKKNRELTRSPAASRTTCATRSTRSACSSCSSRGCRRPRR